VKELKKIFDKHYGEKEYIMSFIY